MIYFTAAQHFICSVNAEGETVTVTLEDGKRHPLSAKALWQLGRFLYGNAQWDEHTLDKLNARNLLLAPFVQQSIGRLDLELRFGADDRIISMSKPHPDPKPIVHETLGELGATNITWNDYVCAATFLNKEVVVSAGDKYGISQVYAGPKIGSLQWPRNYLTEYGAKQFALKVGTRRAKLKPRLKAAVKTVLDDWPKYEHAIEASKVVYVNDLQAEPIVKRVLRAYQIPRRAVQRVTTNFAQSADKTLHGLVMVMVEVAIHNGGKNWRLMLSVASTLITITDMGELYRKCEEFK